MKIKIITLGLLINCSVSATPAETVSQSYWSDVTRTANIDKKQASRSTPLESKLFLKKRELFLDENTLKSVLFIAHAGLDARPIGSDISQQKIALPLPKGGFVSVRVIESPILSKQMAEQYPDIKTWKVIGVENPAIKGRIDFTPKGFHGMITMPDDDDIIFIDPELTLEKNNSNKRYQSLSKRENSLLFKTDFKCDVHKEHSLLDDFSAKALFSKPSEQSKLFKSAKNISEKKLAQIPAPDLITYRLVVAGTGEYTMSQGGTPSDAYSSMITTINRVNDIYQRDLGIKLEIVSGNNFAYTNPDTDPYTNNNARALVEENINNINTNFGTNNYDLGHVFAQGPLGGLSYVGAACQDNYKAGGSTGTPTPQGEIFSVEFVAHEIGHQLGATHTFNSEQRGCGNGNRTPETAVEPGSGSTIMSYTGLCGTDDLQYDSDAMFHWMSIDQINYYTRAKAGSSCGRRTSLGLQNPVANAGSESVIPLRTPFYLEGSATGGSTYSWEQMDIGQPSEVDVDTGDNAIIRALPLSSSQDRYIPRLENLFSGTKTTGEILPQTVRNLTFAFVVRDGNGGIDSDLKTIQVTDTGDSFQVLSQATDQRLSTGQAIDIAWNVAGTDSAPINCQKVNLQLLRENGIRNTLLLATANDGTQRVTIPLSTPVMDNARIMVSCTSQPFFQVSSGNITIQKGVSTSVDNQAPVVTLKGAAQINLTVGQNFVDPGFSVTDNRDTNVSVIVSGSVNTSRVGTYTLTYRAKDTAGNEAQVSRTVVVSAEVDNQAPVVTLKGAAQINLTVNQNFTDPGYLVTDNRDTQVNVAVSGTVNTAKVGTYTLTYRAKDAAGNESEVHRTVVVSNNAGRDSEPSSAKGGSISIFLMLFMILIFRHQEKK